jgi:hypothetical protein
VLSSLTIVSVVANTDSPSALGQIGRTQSCS